MALLAGLVLVCCGATQAQVLQIDEAGNVRHVGGGWDDPVRSSGVGALPAAYARALAAAAAEYELSPELLRTLAWSESGFDPKAVSPAGAIGLMQLMPQTARELGVDPWNPEQNIRGGAAYLRQQLDRFGGDLERALAAYNAGPAQVERHGGVPPFRETRAYVAANLEHLAGASLDGASIDTYGGTP
ncbi:MAG: lytic transglycosylase domain-containing protein [Pseudomonas sp.]